MRPGRETLSNGIGIMSDYLSTHLQVAVIMVISGFDTNMRPMGHFPLY